MKTQKLVLLAVRNPKGTAEAEAKKKAGSSVRVPKLWLRAEKTQNPKAARSGSRYRKYIRR